ncbi:uncharacterized protein PAC_08008 [Phialocephala subalpina]|uniref:Uncharacterized protein n=1 Tax=Phialocephala subalpina TaxID=576137 RepID=A0A1L7WZC8_9HELO|nr:uncharacterized protein PAC_08008 [Phialocephala subalpina]
MWNRRIDRSETQEVEEHSPLRPTNYVFPRNPRTQLQQTSVYPAELVQWSISLAMVNLRLRKIVSTLSILGCPRLRLLCKHPPNLKSIPPISQGMRPSREQKIVQNSAGRKANITFSSNGKPLYTAKAQWCHAQQQLARDAYFNSKYDLCRQKYTESLRKIYLPRYTRVETLQVLSTAASLTLAEGYLEKALQVLDEADAVQMTDVNAKLRKSTLEIMKELEEQRKALQDI